ncbi:NAD-dependent epimerase/dehydratase family protein [Streptomyces sp. NPDC020845]|uniref:NAD-dependent epimerase/dehydratase family protein n=1 Tax=Streptomyces sp. NPDC020845 TaxID=3365096 RepID=UPI0037B8DC33
MTTRTAPDRGPGRTGGSVVVLGGTGFLGRHVCAAFAAAGADVVPFSRTARPALDNCGPARPDPLAPDTGALARLCADADIVVNAAGAVWGGTEQEMIEANTHLVDRLTRALATLPARPRLVQLGSAYEYGPTEPGAVTGEDHPPAPTTPYGRTKLAGTRAVLRAAAEQDIDAVVLRVSVACGPGAPPNSLPGIVAAHLAEGRGELRLAPLLAHRDLVDVRDVADAVVAAARAPAGQVTGTVVNIGSGRAVPVCTLVDLMISLSGRPLRIVEERTARGTRSDAPWQRLDVARARRVLGWAPRRSLEESLADFMAAAGVPPARSRPTGQPKPPGHQAGARRTDGRADGEPGQGKDGQ